MLGIGVQTKNVIKDEYPEEGFALLKSCGFDHADFSLNGYLLNTDLYQNSLNKFFDKSVAELEEFFLPHKQAARVQGITINQMHMPYPVYVPNGRKELNEYLWNEMAPKSMQLCHFFENIVA